MDIAVSAKESNKESQLPIAWLNCSITLITLLVKNNDNINSRKAAIESAF